MKKFNIVQTDLLNIVLTSCDSLEIAKKRLKEMEKTDIYLQKVFGWISRPEYKIVEVKEED